MLAASQSAEPSVQSLLAALEPTVEPVQSWSWIRLMKSFRHSKAGGALYSYSVLAKKVVRRSYGTIGNPTAPFDELDLIRARNLARGGAEKVWKEVKEGVRWVGKKMEI